jgi:hypothetical protein
MGSNVADVGGPDLDTSPSSDSAATEGTHRWRNAGIGVVLFALAVVVPLFRRQGLRSWQTLWAEDGTIFYQQAADDGSVNVLFREFQGYLELTPRLLSVPTPIVPVDQLALYHALAGSIVCALLAWFTYYATRTWISSVPVRLVLASLVVLMPAAGSENTASSTNTIWALAAVAPWAIVSLDERRRDIVVRSIVVFLAATATALSFVFVPLVVGWALVRRSRGAVIVASAYGVGIALQGLTMLTASSNLTQVPPERPFTEMTDLIGIRAFSLYLVSPEGAARLWEDHGRVGWVIAAVVTVALFVVACAGAERSAQLLGVTFFGYAILAFAILAWSRGTPPFTVTGTVDPLVNLRYSVPSTLMMASAFAVVLAPVGESRRRLIARVGRPLFIVHLVVLTVVSFSVRDFRSEGRPWEVKVAEAEAECQAAPPDATVEIGLDRLRLTRITVSCRDLQS